MINYSFDFIILLSRWSFADECKIPFDAKIKTSKLIHKFKALKNIKEDSLLTSRERDDDEKKELQERSLAKHFI